MKRNLYSISLILVLFIDSVVVAEQQPGDRRGIMLAMQQALPQNSSIIAPSNTPSLFSTPSNSSTPPISDIPMQVPAPETPSPSISNLSASSTNPPAPVVPSPSAPTVSQAITASSDPAQIPPPPAINTTAIQEAGEDDGKKEVVTPETEDEEELLVEPEQAKKATAKEQELHDKAEKLVEKEEKIRSYFDDASLSNLVEYIEEVFHVKFITDDAIVPLISGGANVQGHKISFKTNVPLSRSEAWNLFLTFLDLAGLYVIPQKEVGFYRITSNKIANQEVLPTFFDTPYLTLPNNAQKIRYVYLAKNSSVATLQSAASVLASSTAAITTFTDLNALIIIDKGDSIHALMRILTEFDKVMPEAMSVMQLKRANAAEVVTLYTTLQTGEAPQAAGSRLMTQRKQPDSFYFPANVRVIAESRLNQLILLGPAAALKKIEDFITTYVDVEIKLPYSPLHVYQLKYTTAAKLAPILTSVAGFGSTTPAGQAGGIRNGEKYLQNVSITPENTGNKLIIKASDADYEQLKRVIDKLDVSQPQVALEALIVDVNMANDKALGSQIRNKTAGTPVKNVDYQTSGFPSGFSGGASSTPVINANDNGGLLGNLIALVSAGGNAPGTTMLSVGNTVTGVWSLFSILNSYTQTNIISNPFLLTTNNYPAQIIIGNTRRIKTSDISTGSQTVATYDSKDANLTVNITPQISLDGMINLYIKIDITDFANTTDEASGNTLEKTIETTALIGNQEVLVLGGLIKNKIVETVSKVPILGDIPILGWLFKSKFKSLSRSNLLIFISPQIISPNEEPALNQYTLGKAQASKTMMHEISSQSEQRDAVDRWFFNEGKKEYIEKEIDAFTNPLARQTIKLEKERKRKEKKQEKSVRNKRRRTRFSSTEGAAA